MTKFLATARKRIVAHLKKIRSATAREIARALNMNSPNIRHHLSILVSDGGEVTYANRSKGGRGRPEKLYALSDKALGDNLANLTEALLSESWTTVHVEALAARMLQMDKFRELPLRMRLSMLVDELNDRHYHAHWEAGSGGPRVIFGRCPYAKIIDAHPELCRMDTAILNRALGGKIAQNAKIGKVHGACIFVMR